MKFAIVIYSELVVVLRLFGLFCTLLSYFLIFVRDAPLMDMCFLKIIFLIMLSYNFLLQILFYLCYDFKKIFLIILIAYYFVNYSILIFKGRNDKH